MAKNSPVVTGISPAVGPPGTKVKIRGENLGKSAADLLGELLSWNLCSNIFPRVVTLKVIYPFLG